MVSLLECTWIYEKNSSTYFPKKIIYLFFDFAKSLNRNLTTLLMHSWTCENAKDEKIKGSLRDRSVRDMHLT